MGHELNLHWILVDTSTLCYHKIAYNLILVSVIYYGSIDVDVLRKDH